MDVYLPAVLDGREEVMALVRPRRAEWPATRRACATWTRTHLGDDQRCPGRPDGPQPFRHGTRITVADGLVTAMHHYRADLATL